VHPFVASFVPAIVPVSAWLPRRLRQIPFARDVVPVEDALPFVAVIFIRLAASATVQPGLPVARLTKSTGL